MWKRGTTTTPRYKLQKLDKKLRVNTIDIFVKKQFSYPCLRRAEHKMSILE